LLTCLSFFRYRQCYTSPVLYYRNNPKLSTPLATMARETALHAKPRDKILRLYRCCFSHLWPREIRLGRVSTAAFFSIGACLNSRLLPREFRNSRGYLLVLLSHCHFLSISLMFLSPSQLCLSRHVQKQVPHILASFGIDEPTENVRVNIKKVSGPCVPSSVILCRHPCLS